LEFNANSFDFNKMLILKLGFLLSVSLKEHEIFSANIRFFCDQLEKN